MRQNRTWTLLGRSILSRGKILGSASALLLIASVVSGLVASLAMAAAVRSKDELWIVDATGARVGKVLGIDEVGGELRGIPLPWIVLEIGDQKVALRVRHSHFVGAGGKGDIVYYETPACTGTPFVWGMPGENLFPPTAIAQPGQTVYMATAESAVRSVTALSAREVTGGDCEAIPPPGLSVPTARPARPLLDLGEHFTPPYRVR